MQSEHQGMKTLWTPYARECIANPYPMYTRLRNEDPVHYSQTGEWIITSYDDVKAILRNNKFLVGNRLVWLNKGIHYFQDKNYDFKAINEAMGDFILFLNPPDHTRIRKFIGIAWQSRDVESIIKENIDELFSHINGHPFDLIESISRPLPAMTISKIMGIPIKDYGYLKSLASLLIKALDLYVTLREIKKINEAASNFISYFKQLINEKRKNTDNGVISRLIHLNLEDKVLSDRELVSTCILLFIAGEETSLGLTGTGLMNLINHPDAWYQLKHKPTLLPQAVEELIRYDAPVQIVGRIVAEDFEYKGKQIMRGSTVTLCLGSANRDEAQFTSPNNLDFNRQSNKHLGFGGGAHFCLGDWLARKQTIMVIEEMLLRFKALQIMDEQLTWNQNLAIRSLLSLQVRPLV